MENLLQTAVKQKAFATHARIMANGEIVQNTLLEICKDLKAMRDERLYLELDYESFEDYAEKAVGLKQRQDYSYISTYEKLGPKYIEDNSSIGITKLELISQISSYEREEVLEDVDVESASVRELKAKIEEYKKQTEQLSFNLEEKEKDIDFAEDKLNEARAEIEKIRAESAAALQPDDAVIKEAVAKAKAEDAELVKNLKNKIKTAKEQNQADIDKAVKLAVAQEQTKSKKLEDKIDKLEKQNCSLDEKLAKAEQQAKVTGADPNVIKLKIHFDEFQNTIDTLTQLLTAISATDSDTASRLKTAIISVLQSTATELGA